MSRRRDPFKSKPPSGGNSKITFPLYSGGRHSTCSWWKSPDSMNFQSSLDPMDFKIVSIILWRYTIVGRFDLFDVSILTKLFQGVLFSGVEDHRRCWTTWQPQPRPRSEHSCGCHKVRVQQSRANYFAPPPPRRVVASREQNITSLHWGARTVLLSQYQKTPTTCLDFPLGLCFQCHARVHRIAHIDMSLRFVCTYHSRRAE